MLDFGTPQAEAVRLVDKIISFLSVSQFCRGESAGIAAEYLEKQITTADQDERPLMAAAAQLLRLAEREQ